MKDESDGGIMIGTTFKVTADDLNITLWEKHIVRKGSNTGIEMWSIVGYFADLEGVIMKLIALHENRNLNSLMSVQDAIDELKLAIFKMLSSSDREKALEASHAVRHRRFYETDKGLITDKKKGCEQLGLGDIVSEENKKGVERGKAEAKIKNTEAKKRTVSVKSGKGKFVKRK